MGTWRNNLRKVEPYTPGEQPLDKNVIKLNTNENPYPPSDAVLKAAIEIGKGSGDPLRKYPDPNVSKLCQTLSAYHSVWPENVFVGVGSDDVLSVAFQTFFNSNKAILFPDVTYSFYPVWANLYKIPFKTIALDADFKLNPDDYNVENGGIIFANPNAPTGIAISKEDVEKIVANNQDSVVIVDEAYVDFGGESVLKLINKYDNLLVVRTFSKSRSLAGLRVGYAIGSKDLIAAMNNVKFAINSYTMNDPSIELAIASVHDDAYFKETIEKITTTRDQAIFKLKLLHFDVLESSANFVFAKHLRLNAEDIFNELKKSNIYVRHFKADRINNYLRISIGTDKEMDKFFKVLESILVDLGGRY